MAGPKTQAVLDKFVVPQHKGEEEVWQNSRWLNRDTVPLPPSRRTWGAWSYVGFWITTGVNISGWTGGSALLSLGLSVKQAMISAVIGQCLVACCVVMTGLFGAKWHVGFPMWNRVVWGLRASYFPLANRIVLSFTWCSTQAWFGGQVMKTLLGSMFPSIYRMHNVFPESTAMDSADFLCFCLFILVSLPLISIPPEYYRKPFLFTAVTSTVTSFSIFFWALARAKGGGPFISESVEAITGVVPAKGAYLVWAIFYGISSQMGQIVAGILNMSDYTRFAVKPKDQIISQIAVVPIMGIMTTVIGIICTSVAAELYPDRGLLWEPYALLRAIQEEGGSGARAAVFFASFSFLIAQFGINIAGNAISGGIDLASMFPKYINLRRGAYITTAMAFPMCPWALLSGATVFISVMGGYATFLAPICGLMVCDYLLVRKGSIKLSSLYVCDPTSVYFYWKGVNWRAPVAWVCGVAPLFPGFLATVSTVTVPLSLQRVYYLCFPLGFVMSGTIYYALCKIFPLERLNEIDEHDYFGTFGEPYIERDDPEAMATKHALEKVESKEDTVGEIGVFPVRE